MNFGELIFNFPCNIRSKIRYLEKLEKKIVKANIAILFNRTCINENILPKCTDIYIYIYMYIYLYISDNDIALNSSERKCNF